jgi:hypothetical protein
VEELQEAKLRALGVSFGDEDPPLPSISPAVSNLSRQPSVTQYPPLPFSPPVPTSSASSNHPIQQFPFPAQFIPGLSSSATQSPGIPSTASPVSFNGKFNPARQSISIPAGAFQMPIQQQPSPLGFSPQAVLLQQGLARGGSPALAHLNALVSPVSPFSSDGSLPPTHQRHQSLQYPILPHQQFQTSARASPRLHDVQEIDEESQSKSQSKTPEPRPFVQHNQSASLQKEIDAAEYHLEEQLRSQLDTDKDYSPHDERENLPAPELGQSAHAREPSVHFAPQIQRFRDDGDSGPVLHHPRPHSRGHSLANNYFAEEDVKDSTDEGNVPKPKQGYSDVEGSSSNLGTPIQPMDFTKVLQHQRSFSTTSNPWSDGGSLSGKSGVPRRPSHSSKASISKLNVDAPEFKFNPTSSFQPGQFVFGSTSFQPAAFTAGFGAAAPSVNSSQISLPTTASSKINANAPVFSPGNSEFSFSASGPKFRPDAPAFTPFHSLSDSVTSPQQSGSESVGNRGSSIFGNIDLRGMDIVKPVKKSKAIPIVKPASQRNTPEKDEDEDPYDDEGHLKDDTRVKRPRGAADDDGDVHRFAQPTPEASANESHPEQPAPADESSEQKPAEDDSLLPEDTTLSSTIVSESTEAKATTSPSETSPQQSSIPWAPFEFKSNSEVADFNAARPMGDDVFGFRRHKKSLSATARPFVPGMSFEATEQDDTADESRDKAAEDDTLQSMEVPSPRSASPVSPVQTTPALGLSSSRYASSPPAAKGLSASRYAASPSPPQLPPKPAGLAASRYASSPPTMSEEDDTFEPLQEGGPSFSPEAPEVTQTSPAGRASPTFEEIDDIMRHLNENDPAKGVNRTVEAPQWHQPSPTRHISVAAVTESSPVQLPPSQFRNDAPSPSSRQYRLLPGEAHRPMLSTELEDPFVDPPQLAPAHDANGSETQPASDWEGAFTDDEQIKLESRVNFFDGHVNDVVGGLLAARLGPLEKSLQVIQHHLSSMARSTPSSRRDRRSMSADVHKSDADDEDDDMPVARRSMSPRKDRRMDQMRAAVLEALAIQQRSAPSVPAPVTGPAAPSEDVSSLMKAMDDMKEQFAQSLHLDFRGEDLRNIVEDAVERRMPPTPQPVIVPGQEDLSEKFNELQARYAELEVRLQGEEAKVETEVTSRRAAEDRAGEALRKLEMAETKIEVEILNRSAFDQRIADLEDRLKHQEEKTEEEIKVRRTAEDRLSEVQRLLRISSEEETRLREAVEEREQKIKSIDETRGKSTMRLALLEAAQTNGQKTHSDLQNKINQMEADLREKSQEARHWRVEAERAIDLSSRQGNDLVQTTDENKHLRKVIDTLGIQLEENDRVRESWRGKFISLQDDMARAAREIAEDNARRHKKEQGLIARQEVLDARLQAEAKTRERLESELERLEGGERQGMRAVSECKRLEALLGEMRTENHKLQQSALRYQAEFEEARDSAAREVQRTRQSMQAEIESANHAVNVARDDIEDQLATARAQLDQVKLDADTAKARHEMLLEEAQSSKKIEVEEVTRKHQNEIEDMQARYERQLNNTTEDSQRSEQNLLERLSIATSKSQHLQDRIVHLEEKLDIAKEAALAAAKAAKSPVPSSPERGLQAAATIQPKAVPEHMKLPEKISPQALRESIMVLQEQLQQREMRVEELEQELAKIDPEADVKIAKRDDEIIWLRELLAVRHSDLQDIITALGRDDYDGKRVKDAAIRLKANLQMEEQERERALSGGSAVSLPNIAASLRDAATPRVAQAVGPLAAAWGNWRKARDPNFGSLSGVLSSPAQGPENSGTPSKGTSSPASQSTFLSGLLTPPASGMRQTPTAVSQPTAFSNTGRRFAAEPSLNRRSSSSADKAVLGRTPPRRQSRGQQPTTPPMMRPASYDSDAHVEDFDDAAFFDD